MATQSGITSEQEAALLATAVREALVTAAQKIAGRVLEESKAWIEDELRREVGAIAVQVANGVSFERFGTELRITVQFPNRKA